MLISVRLNEEETHQLNWLLKNVNREPKGYREQNISDIIRLALNNEWAQQNLQLSFDEENDLIDEQWKKRYSR